MPLARSASEGDKIFARTLAGCYDYFSLEPGFLETNFRVQSADDSGSSTRASPAILGDSALSVARVLFQTALT